MPSKFFNSRLERKSSKGKKSVPLAISPPNPPKTLSKEGKPLPPVPKFSTAALGRLLLHRKDSLILPRILGSLNRGMERVRRQSLVLGGLGLMIPVSRNITGTETDDNSATNTDTNTITPLLLTSPEVEPEILVAEDNEGFEEEDEDEEPEVRDAVEMTIVPARARLVYIGGK